MNPRHPPSPNPLSAILWLAALAFITGFGGYLVISLPQPSPPLGVAERSLATLVQPNEISARPRSWRDKTPSEDLLRRDQSRQSTGNDRLRHRL